MHAHRVVRPDNIVSHARMCDDGGWAWSVRAYGRCTLAANSASASRVICCRGCDGSLAHPAVPSQHSPVVSLALLSLSFKHNTALKRRLGPNPQVAIFVKETLPGSHKRRFVRSLSLLRTNDAIRSATCADSAAVTPPPTAPASSIDTASRGRTRQTA